MQSRTRRRSVGEWVDAHLRWPETETAGTLVVMTAAAIVGLVFSALWTEELITALRARNGVALSAGAGARHSSSPV